MARLYFSGFETGHVHSEGAVQGGTGGLLTFDTAVFRSGLRSVKCDSGSGNGSPFFAAGFTGGQLGRNYYLRAYLLFSSAFPDNTTTVLQFWNGSVGCCSARVTSTGTLQLWNNGNVSQIGSDSAALSLDTWYRVELGVKVVAGANDDTLELLLDGSTVATTTTGDAGTAAVTTIQCGWFASPGANKIVYVDDVALNDDQSTDENGYPGEGAVVLLLPTGDNARAAKWTGGAGGTSNLWSAVSNRPPAGLVSASATNTSQIEHAGGAAGTTDAYDANMTTYTVAGVPAGSTVTVVQAFGVTGEDIATGTKVISYEVLSNPVVGTSGPVDVGTGAVAAYPTNWFRTWSAPVYNPTVTLGTAPVMRVIRPETATRVASLCLMAMYVEYVPPSLTVAQYENAIAAAQGSGGIVGLTHGWT